MRILGWFCLLILAGCASAVPRTTARPAQADAPFTFNGRVAVKHDGERSSANLRWVHRSDTDEILLMGPLGKTVARIQRDANGVALDTSDKHYAAQDAETLTQQVLGWSLPLSGLRFWVQATAAPDSAFEVERDADGRLRELHQSGWMIRYAQYADATVTALPLRLSLQHEHLELLLLIDEWEAQ
jgi:outer membrane lipoprotein LolB